MARYLQWINGMTKSYAYISIVLCLACACSDPAVSATSAETASATTGYPITPQKELGAPDDFLRAVTARAAEPFVVREGYRVATPTDPVEYSRDVLASLPAALRDAVGKHWVTALRSNPRFQAELPAFENVDLRTHATPQRAERKFANLGQNEIYEAKLAVLLELLNGILREAYQVGDLREEWRIVVRHALRYSGDTGDACKYPRLRSYLVAIQFADQSTIVVTRDLRAKNKNTVVDVTTESNARMPYVHLIGFTGVDNQQLAYYPDLDALLALRMLEQEGWVERDLTKYPWDEEDTWPEMFLSTLNELFGKSRLRDEYTLHDTLRGSTARISLVLRNGT